MLICNECRTAAEDDEHFCSECGAYLEWEGQRVDLRPTEPEPLPEPVPEPTAPGLLHRVRTAVGLGAEDGDAAGDGRTDGRVLSGQGESGQGESGQPSAVPSESSPTVTTTRAAEPAPAAVLPGAKAERPRVRQVPLDDEPPPQRGDLVCGQCGIGNASTRKFCRRCGADLVDAPVARGAPWWRRLWRRRSVQTAAGARPARRARRFPTRLVVVAGVLAALAAAGWWGRAAATDAYSVVADRVLGNRAVTPLSVTASSAAPDSAPEMAADGATNISWRPASPGAGAGEWVEVGFDEPFRLVYVRVFSGASQQQTEFLAQGRADAVTLTMSRANGAVETRDIRLDDASGAQDFRIGMDDVVSVRLTIASAHPSPLDARVAVGELEFLGRD